LSLGAKSHCAAQSRDLADISNRFGQLLRNPSLLRLNLGVFALHLALMAAFVVIPSILTEELGYS